MKSETGKTKHLLRQSIRRIRARLKRSAMPDLSVLAVTGSSGKTTACECLHRIISASHPCHAGIDANDENAVIRALRAVPREAEYMVQEVSGHRPGRLLASLSLIRHRIGIVTTVGLDHYSNFRTREKVAEEKVNMVRLLPNDGVAVLNADDELVSAMADQAPCQVITFGRHADANLRATDMESAWPQRLSMTLNWKGESARLETRMFGELLLPSLLAAVAGGLAAGLSLSQCVRPLQGFEACFSRTSIHRSKSQQWIINDSFKASYWTVMPSLQQVARATAPRKTMVFGSFSDTPGSSSSKYRQAAREALQCCDRVVFCGDKAIHIRNMMKPEHEGRLFAFEDIEAASRWLYEDPVEDELIYIKSNGTEHLERLIMADEKEVKCWKQKCPLVIYCPNCEESGWLSD